MRNLVIRLYLFLLFAFAFLPSPAISGELSNGPTVDEIIANMFKQYNAIKTLRYIFKFQERAGDKMNESITLVKIQVNPKKIYLSGTAAEILWCPSEKSVAALVKPLSFPYFPMNLDPLGSLMRQGQHHTLYEAGFDYFVSIIRNNYEKSRENKKRTFFLNGEEKFNGKDCYRITIINGDFAYVPYVVGKNETIDQIAAKLFICGYLILENNPHCRNGRELHAGETLKIPNSYSKTSTLFIDKSNFLPIGTKVYDEKGLFESYEFDNLLVNPTFAPGEFTKTFPGYHF